jgi:hypothetical protein
MRVSGLGLWLHPSPSIVGSKRETERKKDRAWIVLSEQCPEAACAHTIKTFALNPSFTGRHKHKLVITDHRPYRYVKHMNALQMHSLPPGKRHEARDG